MPVENVPAFSASPAIDRVPNNASDLPRLETAFAVAMKRSFGGAWVGNASGEMLNDDRVSEQQSERHEADRAAEQKTDTQKSQTRALRREQELRQEHVQSVTNRDDRQKEHVSRLETKEAHQAEYHKEQRDSESQQAELRPEHAPPRLPFSVSINTAIESVTPLSSATHSENVAGSQGYPARLGKSGSMEGAIPSQNTASQISPAITSDVVSLPQHGFAFPAAMPSSNSAGNGNAMTQPALITTIFTVAGKLDTEKKAEKDKAESELKKRSKNGAGVGIVTFPLPIPESSAAPLKTQEGNASPSMTAEESGQKDVQIIESFASHARAEVADDLSHEKTDEDEKALLEKNLEDTIQAVLAKLSAREYSSQGLSNTLSLSRNRGTEKTQPAEEQRQRVLLVKRVAAACQSLAHKNGLFRTKIYLGDSLGSLAIRMRFRHHRLSLEFQPETKRAAQLLRESQDELREELSQNQVELEDFEIKCA